MATPSGGADPQPRSSRHRIAGYWQVLGRNSIPFEEMLEVDCVYVTGWSIWQDIMLFLKTVPAGGRADSIPPSRVEGEARQPGA